MSYDPAAHRADSSYDGGTLEVTGDLTKALRFKDTMAAAEMWQKSYGKRPDGKPNAPLTAFTVVIEDVDV